MWKSVSVGSIGFTLCAIGVVSWVRAQVCEDGPDVCAYRAFTSDLPATPAGAVAAVTRMEDPVVRTAAVTRWLAAHPNVPQADAEALCAALPEAEQRACQRQIRSPHLHR